LKADDKPIDGTPVETIAFGEFRLTPAARMLTRRGVPVELRGHAMAILTYLARRPGVIVSKDDLLREVWSGRIVDDSNLTVQVAALRRALGQSEHGPKIIDTVHGVGYVFVAQPSSASPDTPPCTPACADEDMPQTIPRPTTRLIGRAADLESLRAKLSDNRMVTVVGAGGVGKTRVAIELANAVGPDYSGGVCWVDLSNALTAEAAAECVAAALRLGGTDTVSERLRRFIGRRKLLLVLDNCEQIRESINQILQALLAQCPNLVVLATSREVLSLAGETVYRLPSLSFPQQTEHLSATHVMQYDSVRLFVFRVTAMLGDFVLTDEDAGAIARICQRLDGVPLAIEMAAPRLKVLKAAELAARLQGHFQILAQQPEQSVMPRHRTMRAVLDWSYELLSQAEQAVLRRLSVFAGGADLAAVQAVVADQDDAETDTLDHLAALVDKSLVVANQHGRRFRYQMTEVVKAYAAEKRAGTDDGDLPRRHAAHFADFFEVAEAAWATTPSTRWLETYGDELDNARAALTWAFSPSGDTELALRLVAGTAPLYWERHDLSMREGWDWSDLSIERLDARTSVRLAARLWFNRSLRDIRVGDLENTEPALRAVALFEECGDRIGHGAALWRVATTLVTRVDNAEIIQYITDAESILCAAPPTKWLPCALMRAATYDVHDVRGKNYDAAIDRFQRALSVAERLGWWYARGAVVTTYVQGLSTMGRHAEALVLAETMYPRMPPGRRSVVASALVATLIGAGRDADARAIMAENVVIAAGFGISAGLASMAESTALLEARGGRTAIAARLLGFALRVQPALRQRVGMHAIILRELQDILATQPPALVQALQAAGAGWSDHEVAEAILNPRECGVLGYFLAARDVRS
jgi:predicted ATPase/DNA-binding winged helix-turn-helix (wHTH) protein